MRFDITDRVPATAELAEEIRPDLLALWQAVFPEPGAVMVCPVARRAGATTVACALGVAGAAEGPGARVVLVDFDLRRGRLQRRLGLTDGPGLADVIMGRIRLADALQRVGPDELDVLTAGQAAGITADHVGGANAEKALADLREWYDYLIVDVPVVGRCPDAEVLAAMVGRAVLVARPRHAAAIADAGGRLAQAGAEVLGVVLNGGAGRGSG